MFMYILVNSFCAIALIVKTVSRFFCYLGNGISVLKSYNGGGGCFLYYITNAQLETS